MDSFADRTKELKKDLENMFLYGAPNPVLGKRADAVLMDDVGPSIVEEYNKRMSLETQLLAEMKKPIGILSMMGTVKKEKEMDIGGYRCHLCGAKMLQENADLVYKKKVHHRITKLYECGTRYEESFKSNEGYEKENFKTHIMLGDDCVEIS